MNKFQFCMETGCSLRAFDRDVEDIRLYLSDSFSGSEILCDRKDNEYFMSNSRTPPFDLYEFFIMERLLVASSSMLAPSIGKRQVSTHL